MIYMNFQRFLYPVVFALRSYVTRMMIGNLCPTKTKILHSLFRSKDMQVKSTAFKATKKRNFGGWTIIVQHVIKGSQLSAGSSEGPVSDQLL